MPGFSAPVLKPCTASPDPKRKKTNQKQPRVLRTIHVIYSDPNATDSSSDDEQGICHNNQQQYTDHGVKRCVKVIQMLESVVSRQNVLNRNGMRSTTSKYVGVRQRKTGRWVAEIRDPIHNVRHWLGTYNTEEEAHLAYEKKRLELQALLVDPKRVKASFAARKVARSPSSVLEVSNTASHGSDIVANENVNRDCDEREVKEEKFEIKDEMKPGLKIVFDELKEEDFLMCNLGDLADLENSSALLNLDMEDFSWLDEILKYCGFED